MAEIRTLTATVRGAMGKGATRNARREGLIPGIIYGGGDAPEPIALSFRELNKLIYAGHFLTTIFEIELDGAKQRVIPRDYQLDPVKDQPLHVDFLRLKAGSSLRVVVPVHFTSQDTCPGIKKGGSLNVVRHAIEMRVPADAIPDAIVIDLGQLEINETIHINDVTLPEKCRPTLRDRNFTIASIAPPLVVAEDTTAAAAVPAKGKGGKAAAPAKAAAAAAPAKGKK